MLLLALLSLSLAGCTREKKEPERRPIRFAVIAAPEIGADDGDLALAVTALSLVKDLAFVLVPGPLLAGDADEVSLELLKNDLGQIAAPVYVALSTTAAVPSESPAAKAGKLTSAKVFLALESMGPGASHAVSYYGQPEAAPGVVVNALGPDGTGAVSPVPAGTTRLVQLIAGEGDIPNAL
ncbi:hypothetical protein HY251_01945, partial [bacterium]|nr:hypothetical protein [bacterium]